MIGQRIKFEFCGITPLKCSVRGGIPISEDAMRRIAHTKNIDGKIHDLEEHLVSVASKSKSAASKINNQMLRDCSFLLGLFHDIGKASNKFQNYLLNDGERFLHSSPGARIFSELYDSSGFTASLLPLIILGHHGKLSNFDPGRDFSDVDIDEDIEEFSKYMFDKYSSEIYKSSFDNEYSLFIFIKILYSILVDCDRLDTENHFESYKSELRSEYENIGNLHDKFNQWYIDNIHDDGRYINKIRKQIYQKTCEIAEGPPSIYSLTTGTGSGKLMSATKFALIQATKYSKDRIIYVAPFISVIDQTSQIYENIFGEMNVVSHHSFIDTSSGKYCRQHSLAIENWDAPVIATTFVQFFETLFSNRASQNRKLRNIANSVIVVDEPQNIPIKYLKCILRILDILCKEYHCSVLMTTATPFPFNMIDNTLSIHTVIDYKIMPDRVKYIYKPEIDDIDKLCKSIEESNTKKLLCVLNTRKCAYETFKKLKNKNKYYLSTLLYPLHRMTLIKEIKEKLNNDEECIVISTQLIEAGMDLDFPMGIRDKANLDNIAQLGGRVNREYKRDSADCYIVNIDKSKSIYTNKDLTETFIRNNKDLNDPKVYEEFYKIIISITNNSTDTKNIEDEISNLNFETISDKMRIIEDFSHTIFIQTDENKSTFSKISSGIGSRNDFRKIQKYSISISKKIFEKLLSKKYIYQINDDIEIYIWNQEYSQESGISPIVFEDIGSEDSQI